MKKQKKEQIKIIKLEMVLQTQVKIKQEPSEENRVLSVNIGIQDGDPTGIMVGSEESNQYIVDNWHTKEGGITQEGVNVFQNILTSALLKHAALSEQMGVKPLAQSLSELSEIFTKQAERVVIKQNGSKK